MRLVPHSADSVKGDADAGAGADYLDEEAASYPFCCPIWTVGASAKSELRLCPYKR